MGAALSSRGLGIMELIRMSWKLYPGFTLSSLKTRSKVVRNGLGAAILTQQLLHPEPASALAEALEDRPQLYGVLVWPYQSAKWSTNQAMERLLAHYKEVDQIGAPWRQPPSMMLQILDLNEVYPDATVRLHQPILTYREGGMTLSLFVGPHRVYSISFSFFRSDEGKRGIFVGGVQGKDFDQSLELYRAITKSMNGLRTRDFLFEVVRMLCPVWDVEELQAVSDTARHHRHPFFAEKNLKMNYDEIWEDRGGVKIGDTHWVIPIESQRNALEDVLPKKRSMYRKRYAFLDSLVAEAAAGFPSKYALPLPKERPDDNPVFEIA